MEKSNEISVASIRDADFTISPNVIDSLWDSYYKLDTHDAIANTMITQELYEASIGITDNTSLSPITLVTKSKSTECFIESGLELAIKKIIRLKIPTITGMSVTEILNLPTYEYNMLFRAILSAGREESKILDKINNELN